MTKLWKGWGRPIQVMVIKKSELVRADDMICVSDPHPLGDTRYGMAVKAVRVFSVVVSDEKVKFHLEVVGTIQMPKGQAVPVLVEGQT